MSAGFIAPLCFGPAQKIAGSLRRTVRLCSACSSNVSIASTELSISTWSRSCGKMACMNMNTPKPSTTSLRPPMGTTGSREAAYTDRITPGDLARQGTIEDPESMENKPVIYRKVLLRVVFWALGLAACFGAAGVIFAGHDTLWRIVGTCAATAAGAFLMLAASRRLDQETTWLSGVMAVALIVIDYLASLGLIWDLLRSAEGQAGA